MSKPSPENAYLDLLKRSLLNEIYLDDELRLLYLRDCLDGKYSFDYAVYHDIRACKSEALEQLKAHRDEGQFPERNIHRCGFSHTMIGRKRLDSLHECLDRIREKNIPGDFMEAGVWRGGACIFIAGYMKIWGMDDRKLFVADSFDGLPTPTHEQEIEIDLSKDYYPELAVSLQTVKDNFDAYGLLNDNIVFLKGWFKDTLHDTPTDQLALLRLDGDYYESTMDGMTALYHRLVPGGAAIMDDYGFLPPCRQAVKDYFSERDKPSPYFCKIDWSGVFWYAKHPDDFTK